VTSQEMISKRIKEIRCQRGLSQAQLAHPELSDSYISLIESGRRMPTPAVLELIATKLGCSVSYLVNGVTAEEMEDLELNLRYARLALENGETEEARRRFAQLLEEPNLERLPSLRQEAEYGLALAVEACGDLEEAIPILIRLRDSLDQGTPREQRVAITMALTRCYRDTGQTTAAIQVAETEIAAMLESGWSDELIELGSTLLSCYMERGDLLRAHQYSAELLAAAEELGTPRAIVAASWNAAEIADMLGNGDEAVSLAQRALAVQAENGEPRNLARLRASYAGIKLRNRPDESAESLNMLLHAERELRESAASPLDHALCLQHLAMAELNLGHVEQAIEYATRSLGLLDDSAPEVCADTRAILGQAYLALGRTADAIREANLAIELLEDVPPSRLTAETWLTTATVLENAGDQEGSTFAYHRAMECSGL
jgi:tetratricopeptide (TPR) repeat protein